MKLDTLYKRDKTGKKILTCEIEVKEEPNGLFPSEAVTIFRHTGFIDGKKQQHIDVITQGKQNRSIWQQAELEANSHFKSKKDEGYKTLKDLDIAEPKNESQIESLSWVLLQRLPEERTDASGVKKPMKCTATNDTKSGKLLPRVLAKIQYPCDVQTKLDGVRCFATNYENGGFRFTSSAGKSYDMICQHIKKQLDSLNLPKGTILDGELYEHGTPLEKISGWCRTITRRIPEHDRLSFYIFDIPGIATWYDRRNHLYVMFDIIRNRSIATPNIVLVPSYSVDGFDEIESLHDEFVADGYEGAIIRNHKGKYAYGIRSSEIFKMKNFQDDEFEIIGAVLGKRGTFDMVFNCITNEGRAFSAKPLGDAERKEQYWKDYNADMQEPEKNRKVLNQKGTVRYLNFSSYGIPVGNPVLKAIRNYE